VLHAHRLINNSTPLVLANSDQFVDFNFAEFLADAQTRQLDGSILCFNSNHPKWSYAKTDETGKVTAVKEKEAISPNATVGIYYWAKGSHFVETALDMIIKNERTNNEFYVCPSFNEAVAAGLHVGIKTITPQQMHGLGTPEDLEQFLKTPFVLQPHLV
jgi:UDP-N-acetylglucosamine diphosphorylase / glucose-1-phosphate thymidylyltransferase / UDP-N-acetylgalactosamine diphosphorylase / glucosamine-1-phosphate N-acetyltransferase / galactosamine-1-phosphate N-acetyltransferase